MCVDCYRVNEDNAEECVGCGGNSFKDIMPIEEELPPPFYNNAERYKEVENGKEMDKGSHKETRST